ncbi:MAG: alkaline phosphatase, partial [Actinomycetota bacterium]|nr:alkaline phosphatase [Actinomycetota bacterium]
MRIGQSRTQARSRRTLALTVALAGGVAAVLVAVLAGLGNPTSASAQGGAGEARNVILLIGDGMGDSEITIARNYHLGAAGT